MWKTFSRGGGIIKNKIPHVTMTVFALNFILFAVKLYVGLSSNSISIYSDGVNNFFDSLTGLLSFVMLISVAKKSDAFSAYRLKKNEQLLSFIISAAVTFTAFYFAYNSLERLTYPAPVNFSVRYLAVISATALVKLLMFIFLKRYSVRADSSVVSLMSLDSLLDFFITSVTVMTLLLSKDGTYSFDAFCGIGISAVILISAVKSLVSSVQSLTGALPSEKRETIEEILKDTPINEISFNQGKDKSELYIKIKESEKDKIASLSQSIENQTDIKAYFIVCE